MWQILSALSVRNGIFLTWLGYNAVLTNESVPEGYSIPGVWVNPG